MAYGDNARIYSDQFAEQIYDRLEEMPEMLIQCARKNCDNPAALASICQALLSLLDANIVSRYGRVRDNIEYFGNSPQPQCDSGKGVKG